MCWNQEAHEIIYIYIHTRFKICVTVKHKSNFSYMWIESDIISGDINIVLSLTLTPTETFKTKCSSKIKKK